MIMAGRRERFKALRVKQFGQWGGITRISTALEISPSTWSNYECRDIKKPDPDILRKLVKLTGVNVDWLLDGEGSMLESESDPSGKVEERPKLEYNSSEWQARMERIVLRLTDDVAQLRERIAELER